MQTVCVDLGVFIRTVTAQIAEGLTENKGCVAVHVDDERVILFRREWLDNIMNIIAGIFYRNYGGWRLELETYKNGLYTGRVAFVPAS